MLDHRKRLYYGNRGEMQLINHCHHERKLISYPVLNFLLEPPDALLRSIDFYDGSVQHSVMLAVRLGADRELQNCVNCYYSRLHFLMLAGILDPLCKADRYESSVFYEEDVGYSVQVVRNAISACAKVLHL